MSKFSTADRGREVDGRRYFWLFILISFKNYWEKQYKQIECNFLSGTNDKLQHADENIYNMKKVLKCLFLIKKTKETWHLSEFRVIISCH